MTEPTKDELEFATRLASAAKQAGVEIRYTNNNSAELALAMALRASPVSAPAGEFVWLNSQSGPIAQLWFSEPMTEVAKNVLQRHRLREEDTGKSIDELSKRYPFTPKPVT